MKPQTENIGICEMDERDLGHVLQIQNESNLSRWKSADYANEIGNRDSIKKVAKLNDGQVVGFAVVRLLSGSAETELYDSSEIYNIAISKTFQGKGIGQKLFDWILDELKIKHVTEVWLEVRESNKKAIEFYKRNGFIESFMRKNYYNKPKENAYILKLLLNYENQS